MRKPAEFETHPVSYTQARTDQLTRAVIKRVVDGDTVTAFCDLGYFTYAFIDVRIADIDTPEVVGAERARGLEAKVFAETLVLDRPVLLRTQIQTTGTERMTFERYVADVYLIHAGGTRESFADIMRAAGYDKLHPVP